MYSWSYAKNLQRYIGKARDQECGANSADESGLPPGPIENNSFRIALSGASRASYNTTYEGRSPSRRHREPEAEEQHCWKPSNDGGILNRAKDRINAAGGKAKPVTNRTQKAVDTFTPWSAQDDSNERAARAEGWGA